MWWLLLAISSSFAAEEQVDLKPLRDLEKNLPKTEFSSSHNETFSYSDNRWNYEVPVKKVTLDEIKESGTEIGAIPAGKNLIRLEDNVVVPVPQLRYVKYYKLEDEFGFRYLISQDNKVRYKVRNDDLVETKEERVMYEPPKTYRPYEKALVPIRYDSKLKIRPEATFAAGLVQGGFMRDLYNDKAANIGHTFRYGANLFTDWKLPVKVGGTIQYESAQYNLTEAGRVNYNAISFGPLVKSKDFSPFEFVYRFTGQFRVGPFAQATTVNTAQDFNLKFNSADLALGSEHPIKNDWGEFNVGLFYQAQWLNLRSQNVPVSIKATNKVNTAVGLTLSQVFQ